MKLLENVGIGTELDKRQQLNGVVLEKLCECGEKMTYDLGHDYLNYPSIGYINNIYMYCDECGTEYEEALKVRIVVNLEVYE